jgi:serine/threonine protein kinase
MEKENDLIGKQIGNYRLIEEIASGSFGTVYRACHHILTNRIVALKMLHMHLAARERDRFIQEAQFLERLRHRHILPVVDIGFDNGRPYLVSEYAPGGSLRQRLNRTRLLPWDQVQIILTQVGEALYYAHQQNIVHCDLKPENILFNAQGEAVLADFGVAIVLSTMSVQQLASLEGTPSYMAPEQFRGQVSKKGDQYALGCIAYELVTGQRLFSASSIIAMGYKHSTEQPRPPRQINAQVVVHIEEAILKALAKQRNDRHRDVAAFLNALHTPPFAQTIKEEWPNKGLAPQDLKRYQEALEACEQALRLAPNNAYTHINKGIILRNLKRYEEALLAYEQALQLAPNSVNAYNGKGNALSGLKRYEEALLAYEQASGLDPNDAYTYYSKGLALYNLKRYEEALEAYEQASGLDPNNAYTYYSKGLALYNLKRYEEALEAYEQALGVDPNNTDAYISKGFALYNLKRYEEALEAYEQALCLNPNYAVAYYNKGNVLYTLKRYEEAVEAYGEVLHLDPNYALAYNGKGNALRHLNRYEEALLAYEQALGVDPNNAYAYNNKSLTLDRLGRSLEARQAREKSRELGWD